MRAQVLTILGFLGVALTPAPAWAQVYNTQGDTYISQTNPTNNFGNIGTMTVGPLGSPGLGNAALVQVDISRLVALGVSASQIQQATFTVYVHTVGVAGGLDLATLMTPWSESTATYNAAPTPSGAVQLNVPVTGSNGYVTFDITSVLQGWLGSPTTNNGLQITAALAQPNTQIILDTKESTTTSHPAFIDVVLTATGAAGPTGPMGAVGATGAAGPSGSVGPAGAAGPSGSAGPTGAAGPSGSAGPTGAAGPSGSAGPTGAAGPSGSAGPTGAAGPSGSVGPTGAAGPSGSVGATGAAGPSGAVGATGAAGPSGAAGAAGATGAAGPAGAKGAAGATGPNGAAGATGAAGPSGPAGAIGPTGPAGSAGTGASPTSIPLSDGGNSGTAAWNRPGGGVQSVTLGPTATVVAPATCTPSLKIISYTGVATTWVIARVTPSASSDIWTVGTSVISFSTASAAGSSASQIAGSTVPAGTVMTLTSGSTSAPVAPGGGGFLQTFSCQ